MGIYPFYKQELKDKDFVKWDSEYWKEQDIEIIKIENNSENSYIVWNAKSDLKTEISIFFVLV